MADLLALWKGMRQGDDLTTLDLNFAYTDLAQGGRELGWAGLGY